MQQIHTKYHKLFGARWLLDINGQCALPETQRRLLNVGYVNKMINDCQTLPRYVIQPELMATIHSSNAIKSIVTMIESKTANHLPFPEIIVEFDEDAELSDVDGIRRNTKVRQFVWLCEAGNLTSPMPLANSFDGKFAATCWTLVDDAASEPSIVITPLISVCSLMTVEEAKRQNVEFRHESRAGTMVRATFGPQVYEDRIDKAMENALINSYSSIDHAFTPVSHALSAMVMMLHTKGVIAERIEAPTKLNKKRAASGKSQIQDHVLVRIGHVYNRAGEKVEYNKTGRTMPVHWRAGHWRNQRFGVGREKSYQLWIEPMLINYVEGDKPKTKTKEVTI